MPENLPLRIKKLLPWLIAIAFFMESLDATILNTAVPVMANALGVVPLSMKSVLSSYTLSLAVFIPISSWMADRFGTRKVFASAIAIFTLGSLLCGLASNIGPVLDRGTCLGGSAREDWPLRGTRKPGGGGIGR